MKLTCWIVVLQLWQDEPFFQVSGLQGMHKDLIGSFRCSMISNLKTNKQTKQANTQTHQKGDYSYLFLPFHLRGAPDDGTCGRSQDVVDGW